MGRTLRHPTTVMMLVGLTVLGIALSCLGGSVALMASDTEGTVASPPATAVACIAFGGAAFTIGVVGLCVALLRDRGRDDT